MKIVLMILSIYTSYCFAFEECIDLHPFGAEPIRHPTHHPSGGFALISFILNEDGSTKNHRVIDSAANNGKPNGYGRVALNWVKRTTFWSTNMPCKMEYKVTFKIEQ